MNWNVIYSNSSLIKRIEFYQIPFSLHFFIVVKICIKLTLLTTFNCEFSGIQVQVIHTGVQPSPPSIRRTLFIFPTETLSPLNNNSPSHTSGPGTHHPTFCLYELGYSRHLIEWNHTLCAIVSWFISLSTMFSRFVHVETCIRISFLFKAE